MNNGITKKVDALRANIRNLNKVIIALSGGVDSSLVAFIASQELGSNALAVTSASPSLKRADLGLSRKITSDWGIEHLVIETNEINKQEYQLNPENRCYYCKSTLYSELEKIAHLRGINYVLNGTNLDDQGDYRPGLLAAKEYCIRSPLLETGFTKHDIRQAARLLKLENANKPQAACLASRVPYGTPISMEVLEKIEQAEEVLAGMGFSQYRVRHHDSVARIEIAVTEFELAIALNEEIVSKIKMCGYQFVALDLSGFRSGSMNSEVSNEVKIKWAN